MLKLHDNPCIVNTHPSARWGEVAKGILAGTEREQSCQNRSDEGGADRESFQNKPLLDKGLRVFYR